MPCAPAAVARSATKITLIWLKSAGAKSFAYLNAAASEHDGQECPQRNRLDLAHRTHTTYQSEPGFDVEDQDAWTTPSLLLSRNAIGVSASKIYILYFAFEVAGSFA